MTRPIRLLIVDDHPIVRHGISMCLAHRETIQVVGEAGDGEEALTRTRELKPDVLLMDIGMPRMNGLVLTNLLHREMPEVNILILSMYANSEYALRIIQSGARGFVLKEASTEEIAQAIETVHAGSAYFSPEVGRLALSQVVGNHRKAASPAALTNREREVLIHIADGMSNKSIADQLKIGVRTVETHRERIMRKLEIHSIAGLTRFAITQGLVPLAQAPWPQFPAAA